MLFVVVAIDKEDSLALRMATREAHLAYARQTGVPQTRRTIPRLQTVR